MVHIHILLRNRPVAVVIVPASLLKLIVAVGVNRGCRSSLTAVIAVGGIVGKLHTGEIVVELLLGGAPAEHIEIAQPLESKLYATLLAYSLTERILTHTGSQTRQPHTVADIVDRLVENLLRHRTGSTFIQRLHIAQKHLRVTHEIGIDITTEKILHALVKTFLGAVAVEEGEPVETVSRIRTVIAVIGLPLVFRAWIWS